MVNGSILIRLKQDKERITKTRASLIGIFEGNLSPLTESQLRELLSSEGIEVNKTTVYRELNFLKNKKIIKEINFGDGKQRFELDSGLHHHHLVCLNCQKIEDVHMDDDLGPLEKEISKKKKFQISYHSLEFFGLCRGCENN